MFRKENSNEDQFRSGGRRHGACPRSQGRRGRRGGPEQHRRYPRRTAPKEERMNVSLYRAVWRWHFYAGLLILPVLAWMAATGALYL